MRPQPEAGRRREPASAGRSRRAGRREATISIEVPALLAGVRVDRGVAMVADVSRAVAAELIAAGRVLVDGVAGHGRARALLPRGPRLTVAAARAPGDGGVAAEAGVRFEVVHADDDVAVVDKPAGLVVHPGAGHDEGTLVGGLLARFPDLAELVAAGRVPARPARASCTGSTRGPRGCWPWPAPRRPTGRWWTSWPRGRMERRYLALVEGEVADDRGEVDAPIGRSARTPTKMAVTAGGQAGPDRLHRAGAAAAASGPTTLLELSAAERAHPPDPGAHGGHRPPGGRATPATARPTSALGSGRFFLHAFRLAFTHPATGERLEFASPLPDDLEGYLQAVNRSAAAASRGLPGAQAASWTPSTSASNGERGQRLLLGPAHPAHADAEALGRRLQRGRGVAAEAEAQTQHVALEAGQAARPPRGPGRRPWSAPRRPRSPSRRAPPARPGWWRTPRRPAGPATR